MGGPHDCVDCSGTGRVPDVEGQLRAEVARLELREPTQAEGDAAEGKPDESGSIWPLGSCFLGRTGRRCLDCQRWTWGGPTRCERCAERTEVKRLTAQLAERDAALANLTEERDTWRGAYERGVAVAESQDAALVVARGEVARLKTAGVDAVKITTVAAINAVGGVAQGVIDGLRDEVARMEVRVREAAALLRNGTLSPYAIQFGTREWWAESRDAWLAGCKP
jgi:hypothetical protein